MAAKKILVRVPDALYEQIVAYKVQRGIQTLTEAMNMLWQEGLLGGQINGAVEEIKQCIRREIEGLRAENSGGGSGY